MDNGFSASDAVLTSAMSGGFSGNRGGGSWGNNGIGSSFADPGSNAVRINRNLAVGEANDRCTKEVTDANMNRISAQAEEGRRTDQAATTNRNISDSEFRTSDRLTALKDGQFQAELRSNDQDRDIERLVIAGQKEAAACCCAAQLEAQKVACDTQKLILEKAAATDALILAVEGRSNLDKLGEVRAAYSSLQTQVACGCNCPTVAG